MFVVCVSARTCASEKKKNEEEQIQIKGDKHEIIMRKQLFVRCTAYIDFIRLYSLGIFLSILDCIAQSSGSV